MTEDVRGPAGLRFTCQGSGACCRAGYTLGPVEDDIAAGLDAADLGSWWPAAADGWSEDRPGPDGGVVRFLRQVEGACVFLRPDQLCAVHAHLGPQAKPAFCRLFPFSAVRDPKGVAVGVRPNCQTLHNQQGAEVTPERLQEVAELAQIAGLPRFEPSAIRVVGGRGVSLDDWLHVESLLLDVPAAEPRALFKSYREALATAMPGGWSPAVASTYDVSWRQLAGVLHARLKPLSLQPGAGPRHERVLAVVSMLDRALSRPDSPRISEEVGPQITQAVQSMVVLKVFAEMGSFAAGMGLFALGVEVAAHAWPDVEVPSAAFGPPFSMWHDLMVHPAVVDMLRRQSGVLEELFLNA
ncbi:MAG: hypothetical protein GWP91_09170 [Rhodobacterales bacterium]|nr:hypothetical protein [Rhodobacterales bacterium]